MRAKAAVEEANRNSMSYREAALEVLRLERRAMTAREIINAATARGLLTSVGRTPDASLAGRIYTDIQRNGKDSLFIQVGPRRYALREWSDAASRAERIQSSRLKENLLKMTFEKLRERFYISIMSLTEESRAQFIKELISGLRSIGANVTNHLLLLGVHSGRSEAASASDIALLLRYYRINHPAVFDKAVIIMEDFPELNILLNEEEGFSAVPTANGRNSRLHAVK